MPSEKDLEGQGSVLLPEQDNYHVRPRSKLFRFSRNKAIALIALVVLSSFFYNSYDHRRTWGHPASDIANSTLGFQKIFHVSMSGSKHKYDAQILSASITGIDLEWQPGVNWSTVPKKEWIDDSKVDAVSQYGGGLIGAWRSQMNVMEKIVEQNIQTALILEDDADWDISIKEQLQTYAEGVKTLAGNPTTKFSPYGDTWDFLWLGACVLEKSIDDRYYVIDNDTTVAPAHRRYLDYRGPAVLSRTETRLIFQPSGGYCVAAYAVTLAAARKILARVALHSFENEHDVQYGRMCGGEDSEHPLNCYASWPPLFAMHRFEGSAAKDSEIWGAANETHPEYSFNIVYSTTLNTRRYLWGKDTAVGWFSEDIRELEVPWDKKHEWTGTVQTVLKESPTPTADARV